MSGSQPGASTAARRRPRAARPVGPPRTWPRRPAAPPPCGPAGRAAPPPAAAVPPSVPAAPSPPRPAAASASPVPGGFSPPFGGGLRQEAGRATHEGATPTPQGDPQPPRPNHRTHFRGVKLSSDSLSTPPHLSQLPHPWDSPLAPSQTRLPRPSSPLAPRPPAPAAWPAGRLAGWLCPVLFSRPSQPPPCSLPSVSASESSARDREEKKKCLKQWDHQLERVTQDTKERGRELDWEGGHTTCPQPSFLPPFSRYDH